MRSRRVILESDDNLANDRRLESLRSAPMGPRWIKLTPEIIAELRKPIRRRWSRTASTSAGEAASDYNKS
jgi:hypothetical protein